MQTTNDRRAKIAKLKARATELRNARLSPEEMESLLNTEFDRHESKYLEWLGRRAQELAFAQTGDKFYCFQYHSVPMVQAVLVGALMHNMGRSGRQALLQQALEFSDTTRMDSTKRLAELDAVSRELYALELLDEEDVEKGLAPRRDDADPRSVLKLPVAIAFHPNVLKTTELYR